MRVIQSNRHMFKDGLFGWESNAITTLMAIQNFRDMYYYVELNNWLWNCRQEENNQESIIVCVSWCQIYYI